MATWPKPEAAEARCRSRSKTSETGCWGRKMPRIEYWGEMSLCRVVRFKPGSSRRALTCSTRNPKVVVNWRKRGW